MTPHHGRFGFDGDWQELRGAAEGDVELEQHSVEDFCEQAECDQAQTCCRSVGMNPEDELHADAAAGRRCAM
eukprot:CAMPEP_0170230484 /NCGR_PEP_ID=MMETSP0116_2-20130129/14974_1 /TAXON_ID=400756 /ORGANISM="Durinskia baltica, Strain CSIRO CS-38" /LENGTH=71 /DNA_ID=CAMNT_0010481251 /DNA_START=110 /DNA_END=325 /DNA_ORIENTATION=-